MEEAGPLLDLIYSTALEPDLWVPVMERMADALHAGSGNLTRLNAEDGSGSAMLARLDPSGLTAYRDHYSRLNPFAIKPDARQFMTNWKPRITTNDDHLPRAELERTEYYNDFLLKCGVSSLLMIDIGAIDLDFCTVNILRDVKREPFGSHEQKLVDFLHPHLIRAFNLGQSFTATRELGDIRNGALDQADQGVVIVDADCRIRYVNSAADRLMTKDRSFGVADGRLRISHASTARTLEALVAIAGSSDASVRRGGSLSVRRGGHADLAVTVAPIGAQDLSLFTSGRSVLIAFKDTSIDASALGNRLQELFGLTAAETRVALALLNGGTPKSAAQQFGVSVNTVRSQMASIFGKTQTSRQAELSRLLTQIGAA